MKKHVTAFAYLIFRDAITAAEILVVRRSPKDRYFPNMWGVPAGTLQKGETCEEAIRRTAKHRLDVDIEVLGERAAGSSDRGTHVVEMRLYEAQIVAGAPRIRDLNLAGYGYTEVQWSQPNVLQFARERGSLCCRLVDEWLRTRIVAPELSGQ